MERAKLKQRIKWIGGLILVVLCVTVVWQNTDTVSVEILVWEPRMPRAVLLLLAVLVGFGLGVAAAIFHQRRDRNRDGGGD